MCCFVSMWVVSLRKKPDATLKFVCCNKGCNMHKLFMTSALASRHQDTVSMVREMQCGMAPAGTEIDTVSYVYLLLCLWVQPAHHDLTLLAGVVRILTLRFLVERIYFAQMGLRAFWFRHERDHASLGCRLVTIDNQTLRISIGIQGSPFVLSPPVFLVCTSQGGILTHSDSRNTHSKVVEIGQQSLVDTTHVNEMLI